jgi:membrane-bound ClpP family serine protease
MKRLIVVFTRIVGVLFTVFGLLLIAMMFLSDGGFLFGVIGIVMLILGIMILLAKEGYLSESAQDNKIDKLRKAIDSNQWNKDKN